MAQNMKKKVRFVDLTSDSDDEEEKVRQTEPKFQHLPKPTADINKAESKVIEPNIKEPAPMESNDKGIKRESDQAAPVLERQFLTPDFSLSELFQSQASDALTNPPPPILEPEVPIASVSSLKVPKTVSKPSTSKAAAEAATLNCETPSRKRMYCGGITHIQRIAPRKLEEDGKQGSVKRLHAKCDRVIASLKKLPDSGPAVTLKGYTTTPIGPRSAPVAFAVNEPKKPRRRRKSAGELKEEYKILEDRYAVNPEPQTSDIFVMHVETGMSTTEIRRWFRKRNARNGAEAETNSNIVRDPIPGTSQQFKRQKSSESNEDECFDQDQNMADVSTRARGEPAYSNNIGSGSGDTSLVFKAKYLKNSKDRTSDLNVIRGDISKVKDCTREEFNNILISSWEKKAKRIFKLALVKNDLFQDLSRETRRLKEIIGDVSPFSEKQDCEVQQWKVKFKDWCCSEGYGTQIEVEHIITEFVLPWIQPFVYSKLTAQDDRFLTLIVALDDFCKLANRATELEWRTPYFLQYDTIPDRMRR